MIFVTGDMHGELGIRKFATEFFPEGKDLTKSDYVIICGDFGLVWYPPEHPEFKSQQYWLNWLESKPWTTLFVDGNHENFDILKEMPEQEMFGAPVGVISDSIFHLKRGYIYTIQGKEFFTFGGGHSIDKAWRTPGKSWWAEELPTNDEYLRGSQSLKENDSLVDFVITHACPGKLVSLLYERRERFDPEDEEELRNYFDNISNTVNFSQWFFGHYHTDRQIDSKHYALYDSIVEIGRQDNGVERS